MVIEKYTDREMEMFGFGRQSTCPECGRKFFIPVENVYKLTVWKKGKRPKLVHYCRYNCFRKAQKRKEESLQKK